ncbi:hypothetical protein MtrunA17_Chr6g0483011 [Medicago truncatula]|uniref:Transmembrane protein n=1 Tax=Medicago truncatula TaxID=3880 RepID=A0A396HH54_MEDTR|nr:hypothetical protein MtrunA17_Chr6g0483011 [Medicago truncatula]
MCEDAIEIRPHVKIFRHVKIDVIDVVMYICLPHIFVIMENEMKL